MEALLHKVGNDPSTLETFLEDPHAILNRFTLTDDEKRQILEWDLHAIMGSGVSPMALMFAYVASNGGLDSRDEYIRILQEPPTNPKIKES